MIVLGRGAGAMHVGGAGGVVVLIHEKGAERGLEDVQRIAQLVAHCEAARQCECASESTSLGQLTRTGRSQSAQSSPFHVIVSHAYKYRNIHPLSAQSPSWYCDTTRTSTHRNR